MGVANPGGVGACDCESVEKCQSRGSVVLREGDQKKEVAKAGSQLPSSGTGRPPPHVISTEVFGRAYSEVWAAYFAEGALAKRR
jgi:hypothetical protein